MHPFHLFCTLGLGGCTSNLCKKSEFHLPRKMSKRQEKHLLCQFLRAKFTLSLGQLGKIFPTETSLALPEVPIPAQVDRKSFGFWWASSPPSFR